MPANRSRTFLIEDGQLPEARSVFRIREVNSALKVEFSTRGQKGIVIHDCETGRDCFAAEADVLSNQVANTARDACPMRAWQANEAPMPHSGTEKTLDSGGG